MYKLMTDKLNAKALKSKLSCKMNDPPSNINVSGDGDIDDRLNM